MPEYIDKAQAFKHFSEVAEYYTAKANKECDNNGYSQIWNDFYTRAAEALKAKFYIEDAPAANVMPVIHSKWVDGERNCPICGEDKFKDLDADIWADWQPKFCPNCGAKMDG